MEAGVIIDEPGMLGMMAQIIGSKTMICNKCKIAEYRSHIVTGRGDPLTARYLLIGEAPGLSEDVLEKAFIGDAGKLLDEILIKAGIDIDECFFTNTILCRPCNFKGDRKNREPSKEEIINCMPNVMQIIKKVPAELIIFVGRIAKSYYARRLKGYEKITIPHPSAMLKHGGRADHAYFDAVLALKNQLKAISNGCIGAQKE